MKRFDKDLAAANKWIAETPREEIEKDTDLDAFLIEIEERSKVFLLLYHPKINMLMLLGDLVGEKDIGLEDIRSTGWELVGTL